MPKVSFRMVSASRESVFGGQTSTARNNHRAGHSEGSVQPLRQADVRTEGNLKRELKLMRQWRDAGVPLGCRTPDGRRRELLSMPRCRPRETGSGFDALAFDGAVDRRATDAEELGDFEGAVLAAVHQRDQVRFLATVELGLFTDGVGGVVDRPTQREAAWSR